MGNQPGVEKDQHKEQYIKQEQNNNYQQQVLTTKESPNKQRQQLLNDYNTSMVSQVNLGHKYLSLNRTQKNEVQLFMSTNQYQKEVQFLYNAFISEDIIEIVKYLDNNNKLSSVLQIKHEWAPALKTIGSLATELLCEMFEYDEDLENFDEDQVIIKLFKYKQILLKTNIDVKIIQNLQNIQQDRREWSLILLTILVTDDVDLQNYFAKTNMINSLIPLMHKDNNIQVMTLSFEVLAFIIIGRNHLVDQFFNSDKAIILFSSFFKVEQLNCVFRAMYGLIQLIENVKYNLQSKIKVARHLSLLLDVFLSFQEDLLFIQTFQNEDDNNKRKYILTAIKRVLEFIYANIESNMTSEFQYQSENIDEDDDDDYNSNQILQNI